jgi:TonB family protein
MVDIRRNIVISFILHTTLFTVLFFLNDNEEAYTLHKEYLIVSIIKEFSDSLNYRNDSNSEKIEEMKKRFIPGNTKNLSSSFGNIDNKKLEIEEKNNNDKEDPIDVREISFMESSRKADVNSDVKKASNTMHERVLFQSIQSEGQTSLSVNNQRKDIRNTDLLIAIRSSIERAKNYPILARKRSIEGTVTVSFRIDARGSPQNVKIVRSSGYQILDEEVPKMLRKASPFPELSGDIVIPVIFRLKESISDR